MMERWEYRAFGLNFNINLNEFEFITQIKSREFYILTNSNLNIKVRDNTLDIKILKENRDNCQKWGVKLKKTFPIKVATLKEIFNLNYSKEIISQTLFLKEISKEYKVFEIHKIRNKYSLNSTMFEITNLQINNLCTQTIAIEDENLKLLKELFKRYKINKLKNLSYVEFLESIS